MAKAREAVVTDLNLFQYGPHHNELHTVAELLRGEPSCASWIADYRWTEETIVGSETGRVARVWVHHSSLPNASSLA